MLRRQSAINLFIKSFSVRPLRSTFHKTPYCSFRNKKCPTCFTLFCIQLSVAVWFRSIYALIALSLYDCQRRLFFATFLGSLLGNTNFYFHKPIISGALFHSLSCWPQRNAFLNETLFPLTLPIIRPATALRLSHLSSNYALLHFKQTWHSTNYNTTHCFNPKIVLPCHFSFLLIYAKKSQLQLLITMPPFIRQNRDDQVLFPIIQQLYSATN